MEVKGGGGWSWGSFRGLSPAECCTVVFTSTVFLLLMFSTVFFLYRETIHCEQKQKYDVDQRKHI